MTERIPAGPGGRPTKYQPKYCDEVVAFMGEGYSLTAFAGKIRVARSTINEWMDNHQEFSEAVKVGQAARTLSLEIGLLESVSGPHVSARTLALKNSAPDEWREKQHIEHSGQVSDMTNEALDAKLAELMGRARGDQ